MDENKKPGARDISDLKARLGLKKAGAPAAAPPGAEASYAPTPAGGPPARAPGSIPSPFGQPAAPEPAPAAPPDPRRDPFQQQQAANLAAFYGIGQALPGSADSVSGGEMGKPKPWGRIATVLGIGLGVFIVGSFWGGISKTRSEFNTTTDHAGIIRTEVEGLQKNLERIVGELRKGGGGKIDITMAQRLAELNLKKPDHGKIFHTNYFYLEGLGTDRLFAYYNNTIKLYDDIATHAKRTDADKESIAKYLETAGKSDKNYGVIINASAAIPLATFVEVGAPVCPKEGQTDCPPDQLKFKYRLEAGSTWSEKPVKGKPGETVTPLQQTPLFKTVASGSVDALAVEAYGRRLKNIVELVGELEKTQKELMVDLKKTAERPRVFTF